MHVLLIHQVFAGPDDPGGTRHYEIGRQLVAQGHRFTVITSAVNYLTGEAAGVMATALPDGMQVIRIACREDIHRSYLARGRAFFAFAAAAWRAAMGLPDVDIVWGTSPPLVQLVSAWLASRRCPGGFVLEERDLWPEFAVGMGVVRDGAVSRAALRLKRFLYGRARRVVVNSPGFLPFLSGYGVPPEKIRVIPNGVDVAHFDPAERGDVRRAAWGATDRFVILYAGALGPANGLEVVLDAAAALRDTPALFVLVGDGKARGALAADAAARGLTNVRFVPAQPKRAMREILGAADACLATLRDIPLFRTTYPNKVFDYMAAGRPVLLGIDGVIREVVERARAGIFVAPSDGAALAAAVRRLMTSPAEARAMGERGRAAVCTEFDRRKQAADFERLLGELLSVEPSEAVGARVGAEDGGGMKLDARRLFDLAVTAAVLPVALPLMAVVAILVRLGMGSPVLFRHTRTGLRGRLFTLYKFRTMRMGAPNEPDAARLTRVGRLIRSLSLDELPQLLNVLRGDMSVVGPRPLLPQYLGRYTPEQARRHEVRPGITGLAQVSGRNGISWAERFALDVWYVDHRSVGLDARILWRTVVTVLRGDGVSALGQATMSEFMGEPDASRRPGRAVG